MSGGNAAEPTPPSSKRPASERHPRDKGQVIAVADLEDVFRRSFDKVVAVLNRDDRRDRPSLCDLIDADVADTDVPNLPLCLKLGQSTDRFFQRHLGSTAWSW